MKQRKRIYYNAQQRAVIWDRYQQGDSLHDIAKIFDRMHSSIQGLIARTGGIKPPDKTRAASHLTSQERKYFMVGFLTCETTIFCTNGLSTYEFEDSHTMQSVPNRTFKKTNLIKSTAVTRGSK